MNILLLMMAGSGVRFGADIPKQFITIREKPIFSYILKGYDDCDDIDAIVAVTHKDWIDFVYEWSERLGVKKLHRVVAGGDTRSESVRNGLKEVSTFGSKADVLMIHDATHPYVDKKALRQIIDAVNELGGATLGQRQYDTVYRMNIDTHMLERVVPREEIVSGASPEAFRFGDIYQIYMNSSTEELAKMTSAGAIALHYGIPMRVIETDLINLKITYKRDLEALIYLLDSYFPEM